MSRTLLLAVCGLLGACTGASSTTSLAGLTDASVSVSTHAGGPTAAADVSIYAAGCPTIADDVVATFDGHPLTIVSAGGFVASFEGTDCAAIQLSLATAEPHPGAPSMLTLADATATWTVTGYDLLTNDLMTTSALTPGAPATAVWPSAATIDGAYVELENQYKDVQFAEQLPDAAEPPGTITGHTMQFNVPAGIRGYGTLLLDASRTAPAIRCEGPTSCTLDVTAHAELAASIL